MPIKPPPPPKPTIPEKELKDFLEGKLTLAKAAKIEDINASFLWEQGGYERYRVNVWVTQPSDLGLYEKQLVGSSFFIHYDRSNSNIIDKTIKSSGNSSFLA